MPSIRLKAANGQYVCAEGGGGRELVANRDAAFTWETFQLNDLTPGTPLESGNTVSLRSYDGHHVQAVHGGGSWVGAIAPWTQEWETFNLVKVSAQGPVPGEINNGDRVALRAYNGQYVCAEGGGGRELVANRGAVGPWETFTAEIERKKPLNIVVLGDSIMWGQGLRTFDKFTFLTRDWIKENLDVPGANPPRQVNPPYVFAHSGAQIVPRDGATDPTEIYWRRPGEVPLSVPSITRQVDIAKAWLGWDGIDHSQDVDLVLMDGGINDVGVFKILDPTVDEQWIRGRTRTRATDAMRGLLRKVLNEFPKAKVVITAYHEIVTPYSPDDELETLVLGFNIPFFEPIDRDAAARRSWAFANEALQGLHSLRSELSQEEQNRVRIVRIPWPPTAGYGVPDLTWEHRIIRVFGGYRTNDALYFERKAICASVGAEEYCHLAAAGHPNEWGVKDAWLREIRSVIWFSDWLYEWGRPRPEAPPLVCWPVPESPSMEPAEITINVVDGKTHMPVLDATATLANPLRIESGRVIWETHTGIPTNRPVMFDFKMLRDAANDRWIFPVGTVSAPGYPDRVDIPFNFESPTGDAAAQLVETAIPPAEAGS